MKLPARVHIMEVGPRDGLQPGLPLRERADACAVGAHGGPLCRTRRHQHVDRRHHRRRQSAQVHRVVSHMLGRYPQVDWNLHLHNTRDMALANALAAMRAGMTRFDGGFGGFGGFGGCPYAPGATGSIATEDMVNMLHEMGVETGIDLDALIAVACMQQAHVPHAGDNAMLRAGPKRMLGPAPERQVKIG